MTIEASEENDLNNVMRLGQILDLVMKFPARTSIMLSGPPGIGKTAIAEELAKRLNAKLRVYLAATQDPTDLSGVPHCNEAKKTTVFYAPEDFLQLTDLADPENMGAIVALFDDITTANDSVFASYFRMFQQRQVANILIRDNVLLIGTGNRVEDRAAAHDLPSALANRMFHIDVQHDDEAWIEWAQQAGIQPQFVSYIRTRPEQLYQFDPNKLRRAFATPRSIEMASKLQAAVGVDHPLLHNVIAGCVGKEWATEYTAYLANITSLIPPEDILKNPKGCPVPSSGKIDVLHATLSSLIHYVIARPSSDNVIRTLQYAQRIKPVDLSMILIHAMLRFIVRVNPDPSFRGNVCSSPEFVWAVEEQGYILEGAKSLR